MNNFATEMPSGNAIRHSALGTRQSVVTALRVFRPPLPVSVVLHDGRPVRLACPERPALAGDVTWCAGPWRSSGEWWDEQAWSREEWDVALSDALYRIYRDTTGWFVEGSYD